MKKWYGFTTYNPTLKDGLRRFLKENSMQYELSGCYEGWHFEMKLDSTESDKVDAFLDAN